MFLCAAAAFIARRRNNDTPLATRFNDEEILCFALAEYQAWLHGARKAGLQRMHLKSGVFIGVQASLIMESRFAPSAGRSIK